MTVIANEKLGIRLDIPPFTQRDLETYYRLIKEDPARPTDPTTVEGWSAVTRAAVKMGWLNGVELEEIQEWLPAKLRFISIGVGGAISEATDIPKV